MKEGFKFIVTYSFISVILFVISTFIFKDLTGGTSDLVVYYFLTLGIGMVLYPTLSWLLYKFEISLPIKFGCSLILCLLVLNIVPLFEHRHLLSVDLVKAIVQKNQSAPGFDNMGIHAIALISFITCFLLFRNDDYWRQA